MIGPTAGPPANPAAQAPMAIRRWFSSGNMDRSRDRVDGASAAPPTPSRTLAMISISGVVDIAATSEATPNVTAPTIRSRRRP